MTPETFLIGPEKVTDPRFRYRRKTSDDKIRNRTFAEKTRLEKFRRRKGSFSRNKQKKLFNYLLEISNPLLLDDLRVGWNPLDLDLTKKLLGQKSEQLSFLTTLAFRSTSS